ncbi:MAG: Iron-sulfur cluster assembly accessory protein, partial [Alphaproteobacteria bacterium]|nr:Iron-sulfur cluster assembly accessory protein [Alphaproteobacteria bacterium]
SPTILNVTENAANQIRERLLEAGEGVIGLRVGIKARGCSGMAYFMEYAKTQDEEDEIVEKDGIKVLVDPSSMMYLLGTTIDYVSNDIEEGFTFKNPNEKSRCGCGESFNT